ncbi:MAG: COX15/CtaA family protein [Actinomycetota bacterium]
MRRFRLSPTAFAKVALVAGVLLAVIIVTGAAVRLTGSGLGCPDWPNCEPGRLTPKSADDVHAVVEFVNRVFTGAVSMAVIVCVLGSVLRDPRRRDLIWLSLGLVAGVIAQAVVGGLTVLFELRPEFVMTHFLLSLVLLTNAVVLYQRATQPRAPAVLQVDLRCRTWSRGLVVAACVVVATGTVVTSTGPHGGDEEAKRFAFEISHVARIHGISVMAFLTIVLVLLARLRRTHAPEPVVNRLGAVLLVACVQAAIGYIQYFNDIPALLVGLHIAGATALWVAVIWYFLGISARPDPTAALPRAEAPAVVRTA